MAFYDVFYRVLEQNDEYLDCLDTYSNPAYSFQKFLDNFLLNHISNEFRGQEIDEIPESTLAKILAECIEEGLVLFEKIESPIVGAISTNLRYQNLDVEKQRNILPILFMCLYPVYLQHFGSELLNRELEKECAEHILFIHKVINEVDLSLDIAFEGELDDDEVENIRDVINPLKLYYLIDAFSKEYPLQNVEKGDYRLMLGVFYSLEKTLSPTVLMNIKTALESGAVDVNELNTFVSCLIHDACTAVYNRHLHEQKIRDYVLAFMDRVLENGQYDLDAKKFLTLSYVLEIKAAALFEKNVPIFTIDLHLKKLLTKELSTLFKTGDPTVNSAQEKLAAPAPQKGVLTEHDGNKQVAATETPPQDDATPKPKQVRFGPQ